MTLAAIIFLVAVPTAEAARPKPGGGKGGSGIANKASAALKRAGSSITRAANSEVGTAMAGAATAALA
ncbi:hypothetical protein H4R33_007258, partial [Dimargaris cristalligena]